MSGWPPHAWDASGFCPICNHTRITAPSLTECAGVHIGGTRASVASHPNQHDWDEQSKRCRKCGFTPLDVPDVNWCSGAPSKRDDQPAVSSLPPPPEPVRRSYSREEIIAEARAYMVSTFGKPNGEAWHQRLGLLVDFLSDLFPPHDGPMA